MTAPDVPCGLLVLDDELLVRDANPAAAALLGAEPGGLVGRPIRELLTPGARMFFHTHVHPSLGVLGRVDELYLELVGADGAPIPIVVDGRRGSTPDGPRTTLAFLAMRRRRVFEHELVAARDAAEAAAGQERAARARLAEAHAQLALQERLASLGTLAQGIAHEINNPLTAVSVTLELLSGALGGDAPLDRAELARLADDALTGADRIRDVTRQMSQLARADEQPRVVLDPRDVARLVVRLTAHQAQGRAHVVAVDAGEVPLVDGDAGRLGQVLINLVVNAIQAFGSRAADQNHVTLATRTGTDGHAWIEVADDGPGIPPAVAGRVFEPFFTTKPVGEGTGLGLSVSQGLVAALGGTLTFETAEGRGTTFRVALPPSTSQSALRKNVGMS